ncbi:MAG: glycosyltransferase family 39 protein [Patescibacteria group bacterium]
MIKRTTFYLLTIFLGAFLLRLLLYKTGTFYLDVNSFIAWSNTLVKEGLKGFYPSVWSDYLPGYLYVLWILAKVREFFPLNELLFFKLPGMLADLATGWLIFSIVKKLKSERLGLISAAFYVFNPAILANSTLWGQVDSFTALFLLLSIYLVKIYPTLSLLALSLGTLVKPQVALGLPVIFFIMVKDKWKIKEIVGYVLTGLAVFVMGFLPFYPGKQGFFPFIIERILITLNQYPFGSVNAFNFWGLWGFWKPDSVGLFSPKILGLILFGLVSALATLKLWKKENSEYLLAAIFVAVNFLFFTRMHERHLLPLFAPLAVAASISPVLWISYLGFSSTHVLNLYYSFEQQATSQSGIFTPLTIKVIIFSNLAFFIFLSIKTKLKIKALGLLGKGKSLVFEKVQLSEKHLKILLLIVIVFSFLSKILWLGSPKNEYFDEVYHAFTARRMLHSDPKAWEWWNTPPEGFAYEWTHPPLAKLGMVLGMLIFGENSFGWRMPGALLGVGSVFLVFLIAKKIFDDKLLGILSAAIFSLDGLPLVMSRIGMNDSYLLFFVLLAIYLFLVDKHLFSAVAFGLAISSKWSAVWAIPILTLSHFVLKKKIKLGYLWFLILPAAVYLATYAPMFLTGHGLDIFWGMQKQMWWYHTGLKATHPYTSPWWSWPLLARPIYLYTSNEVGGFVSRIYATGNPLIFWAGLASIIVSFVYSLKFRIKKLALVIFSYLVFFVPWAASPRIMFLYHYLPSIPFLAIALGYILRRNLKLIVPAVTIALLLFLYFYPHWAGLSVPLSLDKSYYWFSSWR